MSEPTRQYLFSARQIRTAFVLSGIGLITVAIGLLLLASSRPQGKLQAADTSEFEATLAAASEDLTGFERIGENRARIDIDTAMALVVERGVGLEMISVDNDVPPTAAEDGAPTPSAEGPLAQAELPDGEAAYAFCSACHQPTGGGIPGAFPPLAGHAADLYNASGDLEGRDYLVQVVLQGLQGTIVIDGATYNGLMPAWPQLSDGEIAAVLNYVLSSWGNDASIEDFVPYSAEQVATQRANDPGEVDLLTIRDSLSLP